MIFVNSAIQWCWNLCYQMATSLSWQSSVRIKTASDSNVTAPETPTTNTLKVPETGIENITGLTMSQIRS